MPDHSPTTPPGLLLATELRAHYDRARERVKQLAAAFSIPLATPMVHHAPEAPGEVFLWLDGAAERERKQDSARAM